MGTADHWEQRKRRYWERRIGPGDEYSTGAVAQIVKRTQRTVQRWIAEGKLRALGGSGYHATILREDLLDFLVHEYDGAISR